MNTARRGARLPAARSQAFDEPAYELLHQLDEDIEIRRYAPYAVAEVFDAGPADGACRRAVPILAGYLGGNNRGKRTFAMTVPVTQSALDGGTLVRCVLPKGITKGTAPRPTDARVELCVVAGHTLAALRYPGSGSPTHDDVQVERLTASLRAARMSWAGAPQFSRYNARWTPWFLRRNEVWLRLP